MFWQKAVCSYNCLSDIPGQPLAHFNSQLISSGLKIPLQSEVNPRSSLVYVFRPLGADSAFAEENSYERGVVLGGPVFDWEHERVGGIVHRRIAEFQVSVQRYSGVIEAEAEKGQLEVEVFVDLGGGGLDGSLPVSFVVGVASFVEVPVHELSSYFPQSGFCDGVGYSAPLAFLLRRISRCQRICPQRKVLQLHKFGV